MGLDYLGLVHKGDIKENNIVLMASVDGARLYEHKESDWWILIWIFANLSPQKQYQKECVQLGTFIPGPNKPKHLDSLFFPLLHHPSMLQNEGLKFWDANHNLTFQSNLYLLFPTVDGPSLVDWDGLVGHSNRNGCHIYCGILRCCKSHGHYYYPVLIKPRDWCAADSDHPDINVLNLPLGSSEAYADNLWRLVALPNHTQYDQCKTKTKTTKAPLILRLGLQCSLGIPYCMTTDIMHLTGNISDLLHNCTLGSYDWLWCLHS